jgi:hypothetical protein
MNKEVLLLDLTLEHIPKHGAFEFFEKMKLIDNAYLGLVKESFTSEQHLNVTEFLCIEGYAVKIKNINPVSAIIELTDKGRELKECGSLIDYYRVNADKIAKQRQKALMERKVYCLTVWVTASTVVMAVLAVIQIWQIFSNHK